MKPPISITHPELAKQAHGWDPSSITFGSHQKREWRCANDHVWAAAVKVRSQGNGCPICAGKKVLVGFNDLSTTDPELAKQALDWDPSTVTKGSNIKKQWQCQFGHVWITSPSERSRFGCPYCSSRKILVGFNDLATTNLKLASQAFNWDPTTVFQFSGARKDWRCELGHIWSAKVSSRATGTGCPVCSGNSIRTGVNDLSTIDPKLALQAYGWDPGTVTKGSNISKKWKCELGHVWNATVNARSGGNGCPYCSGQKLLIGFNDLATINPALAGQAFEWDPKTVVQFTGAMKKWKCELGHVWSAQVSGRSRGNGCPYCSNKRILVGFNDLATVEPDVAKEAFEWDPKTVTRSVSKKMKWKCQFGHIWNALVSDRTGGHGCPVCSGNLILIGFNDLATISPSLANQAFGWDPSTVTIGTESKRKWKCELDHIWSAAVKDRYSGRGCPSCAKTGFDPNSEGWIYFLTHPRWQMLQIGITNNPEDRLSRHKRLGWKIIEIRGPMDGLIARGWETSILQMLKRHGAEVGPERVAGKFDGYTESWLVQSFPAKSLRELMELVIVDEDKSKQR